MTQTGRIYIMNVPFVDEQEKSKTRPILIWEHGNKTFFYKITSKFINKSDAIRSNYFPIMDWKSANLKKPSFVDLNNKFDIIDYADIPVKYCGELSTQDLINLRKYLNSKYSY